MFSSAQKARCAREYLGGGSASAEIALVIFGCIKGGVEYLNCRVIFHEGVYALSAHLGGGDISSQRPINHVLDSLRSVPLRLLEPPNLPSIEPLSSHTRFGN